MARTGHLLAKDGTDGRLRTLFDNRRERETAGAARRRAYQRSGSDPVLADTGATAIHRGEVHHMKKKLFVRVAAVVTSLVGLLLAGGAGFGVR